MSTFGNRIRQEIHRNRLYVCVILMLLAALWAQSVFYSWNNSATQRIAIVHDGTLYLAQSNPVMLDHETNKILAKRIAADIFNRSPKGLDNPEELSRLFNTALRNEIISNCEKDKNVFLSEQAVQAFHLTQEIDEQYVNDQTVKMLVQGDLVLTEKIHDAIETSSKSVRVTMVLTRNDDWLTNYKYPKVCTALNIEYAQ